MGLEEKAWEEAYSSEGTFITLDQLRKQILSQVTGGSQKGHELPVNNVPHLNLQPIHEQDYRESDPEYEYNFQNIFGRKHSRLRM